MFVLRPDGQWVDFNAYACQGKPEAMDEIVFPTMAEVMTLFGKLTGPPRVLDLPIDEAVPMLFRMGVDGPRFAARVQSGENFLAAPCNSAAGISTDEKINWPHDRKVYIFSPVPWTKENFENAMEAMKR